MKIESMNTPATREEFERHMNLLAEQIKKGKMSFLPGTERGIEGLFRARLLPNGRLDLLSIDESTRLQANMMNQFAGQMFDELLGDVLDDPAP